jgi:hypothetical protein
LFFRLMLFRGRFLGRKKHLNDLALRLPLRWRYCLSIEIKRQFAIGVPQRFLHGLDVLAVGDQERRYSAPECVPANRTFHAGFLRRRPQMPSNKHSRQVRLLALLSRTCKYLIARLVVGGCEPPFPKHFRQKRVECDRFLRCLALAASHNPIHDRAPNIDF